jgi:Glycosyl hydrolase family 26
MPSRTGTRRTGTRRTGARRRRLLTALTCVFALIGAAVGATVLVSRGPGGGSQSVVGTDTAAGKDAAGKRTARTGAAGRDVAGGKGDGRDGLGVGDAQALGRSLGQSAPEAAGATGRAAHSPAQTTRSGPTATSSSPVSEAVGSPVPTAGTRSGLPWLSGVWVDNSLSESLAFGTWRNRPLDTILLYTARDQGWAGIVQPTWPVTTVASFPGRLILSVPPYPQGAGSNATCATGAYDAQWRTFGTFLVAHHRADTIVRLGWEFNGTWFYWNTGANPAAFKSCYQHVAAAIRSTDPSALMDWTFTAHRSSIPAGGNAYAAYPGDASVDFIGIDPYDMWPASHTDTAWNSQCSGTNGLCGAIAFARAHGKKVGIGEWGVASCNAGGGGDNSFYITQMYRTLMANAGMIGYEAYFDDPTPGNVCSSIVNGRQNPKAAAAYKALFGRP